MANVVRSWVEPTANIGSAVVELIAIAILTGIAVYGIGQLLLALWKRSGLKDLWSQTRKTIGQGILFALELLVAADIMETVAVDLTYQSLGVLAAIVLIRTFLSFTLEVELTGRWPWQNSHADGNT